MQEYKEAIIKLSKLGSLLERLKMEVEDSIYHLEECAKEVDLDNKDVIRELQLELNSAKAQREFLNKEGLLARWQDEYYQEFVSSVAEEDIPKILEQLRLKEQLVDLEATISAKFNAELELSSEIKTSKHPTH